MLVDVRPASAQSEASFDADVERPTVFHIVGPLICRNCLISQARWLKDQGVAKQHLAAVNVETKTAERFALHNDSALVSDIVTVVPIRKASAMYASITSFTKDISSNRILGILVVLPDGTGEFFEYTSSFGDNGKILPNVATRLNSLLGRTSN